MLGGYTQANGAAMNREQFTATTQVIEQIKVSVLEMLPPSTVHQVGKRYGVARTTVNKILDGHFTGSAVGRKPKLTSSKDLIVKMDEDIKLKTIDEYVEEFRRILEEIDGLD